uniref:Uncharacterized protein n=1 Tax=Manihot esculenta TaxID=3983 RepID=A0A2C9W9X6_MANES
MTVLINKSLARIWNNNFESYLKLEKTRLHKNVQLQGN